MTNVVVTRVKYSAPPRRSRSPEERLMVLFPSLYRRLAALIFGPLSPRSRLRRALLRRALVSGWAAFYRRDFKLMLVRYAANVEFEFNPGMQTLGLGGAFRGHEGVVEALGKLADVWDAFELYPSYIIDLGERVLFLGFSRTHARASGVTLAQEFAQLVTLQDGLETHEQAFFSWEEGMRAAGLDPDAIALAKGGAGQGASGSLP